MKHLKIGDLAPDWSGTDENGNIIQSKDLIGTKTALYFYPKDNTPACNAQACNIRDNILLLKKENIRVLGISADSSQMHKKFIAKFELPFSLLADENKSVIETFGVWGEKKFMGKIYDGIHRTTFLINERGNIIDIIDKPKTKEHAAEILERFNKKS